MSLADQLKAKKDRLNRTSSKVTSIDGRCWLEDLHSSNKTHISDNNPGFVVDTKPDLRISKILDKVYMSSQDVAHDLDLLQKYGITHILNVATGVPNLFDGWFVYETVEAFDVPEFSILDIFEECCDFINRNVKSGGHVLIHCNAGVSRSASVVIAYLMKYFRMNFDEAFRFVKNKRSFIRPNEGFVEQLKIYEKKLNV